MYKAIKQIVHAPPVTMGNIQLRQALPAADVEQVSPFILLHHFDFMAEPGQNIFDVAPHPHRGFMPVTFMFDGSVEHEDSLGNAQVIGPNEVQWINAARGIIHSEKMGKQFLQTGGRFQGVQLWINLPKADKMKTPFYQPLTTKDIVLIEEPGIELRIISGNYKQHKGPAKSGVFTATMLMEKGSTYTLSFPPAENTLLYVLEGVIKVNNDKPVTQHDLAIFDNNAEEIFISASANASVIVLSGQPINEPLVTQGPFVMNTQTEILEAMRDYQMGKMGFLY